MLLIPGKNLVFKIWLKVRLHNKITNQNINYSHENWKNID